MKRKWMKGRPSLILMACLVGLCLPLCPGFAQEKPKMPADFAFDQGKDSPGKVTFSHEKHVAKSPKCTACHVQVFKMKRGATPDINMAAMNEGRSCGTCHNGKEIFSTNDKAACSKCHLKQ